LRGPRGLAVALVLSAIPPGAALAEEPFLVVIDPGHGGDHQGAVGPAGNAEKNLTLRIARRVADRCRKELHARVVLTRDGDSDVELQDRVEMANRRRASLFLSIHLNSAADRAARRTARGVETYFLSADPSDASAEALAERENLDQPVQHRSHRGEVDLILNDLSLNAAQADSSRLAYAVHQRLVEATGEMDRGVHQAPFFVLTGARMPAVLLEVAFISNPDEERQLLSAAYQDRVAEAVVQGIRDFRRAVAPRALVRASE
jgi:N-acetylmuramoyl-L-alanine amidase